MTYLTNQFCFGLGGGGGGWVSCCSSDIMFNSNPFSSCTYKTIVLRSSNCLNQGIVTTFRYKITLRASLNQGILISTMLKSIFQSRWTQNFENVALWKIGTKLLLFFCANSLFSFFYTCSWIMGMKCPYFLLCIFSYNSNFHKKFGIQNNWSLEIFCLELKSTSTKTSF